MTTDQLEKAKHTAQIAKEKDAFCALLKQTLLEKITNLTELEGKTFTDRKNLCDILNGKGDPQLTTILKILSAVDLTLAIVPKKPKEGEK